MFARVLTKDAKAVELEVQAAYQEIFPNGDGTFVPEAFARAMDCFGGRFQDYQAIDASYHDLEHTMQGTLCMVRLLVGRHRVGDEPRLTEHLFRLGILAILYHDSGYLKRGDDAEGTGAKYTLTHVNRSAEFSAEILRQDGFSPEDIRAVKHMIHCTGVSSSPAGIPFQNELEKIVGFALGTGDLLGQMAAEDYVDKLPALYKEFSEAVQHSSETNQASINFGSAAELMAKTPLFWEGFVKPRLEKEFQQLYRYLSHPYPSGTNEYISAVEANINRLQRAMVEVSA
jgi:hypothetical protein